MERHGRFQMMQRSLLMVEFHLESILRRLNKRKSLPIGISDYVRAQSEYYYVDKTLLIKKFLDKKPLVSLFTRPRRFGKP